MSPTQEEIYIYRYVIFSVIRNTLQRMDENYKPGITFICSIRNSHQKMFCAEKSDERGQGRNVPAGTVMSGYGGGMPESYHFHLSSHAGVGTVNPTFYNVLHDDNEIELDNMCNMTYALALDSKRCEKRSVSCNHYFFHPPGCDIPIFRPINYTSNYIQRLYFIRIPEKLSEVQTVVHEYERLRKNY